MFAEQYKQLTVAITLASYLEGCLQFIHQSIASLGSGSGAGEARLARTTGATDGMRTGRLLTRKHPTHGQRHLELMFSLLPGLHMRAHRAFFLVHPLAQNCVFIFSLLFVWVFWLVSRCGGSRNILSYLRLFFLNYFEINDNKKQANKLIQGATTL